MPDATTPPPFALSKLRLVEALDARGLLAAFDTFLAASLAFRLRWCAAQEIQSDNAAFSAAFAAFAAAADLSAEDAAAILDESRAGEAPTEPEPAT